MKVKKVRLINVVLCLFFQGAHAFPFAYVTNQTSNNVSVIDIATNTVVATINGINDPTFIAITHDGQRAYVVNATNNTVTPINTLTNTAGTPIAVGPNPEGIAITPDDAFAYVVNFSNSTVSVIDLSRNMVVDTIDLGAGVFPFGIAITPDGKTAYVTAFSGVVIPINIATNTPGTPISVTSSASYITITPNGKKAYVSLGGASSVVPITLANNMAGTPIVVGGGPAGLAVTPDSSKVYVANAAGYVSVIDVATDTVIETINIGAGTSPLNVAITADGKTAYVVNFLANNVVPIPIAANEPGTPITVGINPFGIAIAPLLNVNRQIVRNCFLNRTDCVLILLWERVTGATAYQIFNGGVLIGTVPARCPLEFRWNLCRGDVADNFVVIPVV